MYLDNMTFHIGMILAVKSEQLSINLTQQNEIQNISHRQNSSNWKMVETGTESIPLPHVHMIAQNRIDFPTTRTHDRSEQNRFPYHTYT